MSTAADLLTTMQSYKRLWMQLRHQPGYMVHPRMARYMRDATQLSQNPYIYPDDMEQLYSEALWNVGGRRRRRGSMRRGRGRGRRPHRRFRRFHRRPFRRRFRPVMMFPSYSSTQTVVLSNLEQKINMLWAQLKNKKRWRKTAPADMRSPRIFFSLYPL